MPYKFSLPIILSDWNVSCNQTSTRKEIKLTFSQAGTGRQAQSRCILAMQRDDQRKRPSETPWNMLSKQTSAFQGETLWQKPREKKKTIIFP